MIAYISIVDVSNSNCGTSNFIHTTTIPKDIQHALKITSFFGHQRKTLIQDFSLIKIYTYSFFSQQTVGYIGLYISTRNDLLLTHFLFHSYFPARLDLSISFKRKHKERKQPKVNLWTFLKWSFKAFRLLLSQHKSRMQCN